MAMVWLCSINLVIANYIILNVTGREKSFILPFHPGHWCCIRTRKNGCHFSNCVEKYCLNPIIQIILLATFRFLFLHCESVTRNRIVMATQAIIQVFLWHLYPSSCINHIILATLRTWTLQWRHNDHNGVSNHQPGGCLLNRLFRRRSKKTSKLCVTGLCAGNSPGPVNSPHKGPVTRKIFPFDDVIMEPPLV